MTAAPLPYSPIVRAGDFAFVSGQLGLRDGELVEGLEAQVRTALANLLGLLEANGLSLANLVKTTVFLTSADDFPLVNEIYAEFFEGKMLPARSAVVVAAVPRGAIFEIEAVAYVG